MIFRKFHGPSTAQFFFTRVHLQCFCAHIFLHFWSKVKKSKGSNGHKKSRTRSVTMFFELIWSFYVILELSDVSFGPLSKKLDFFKKIRNLTAEPGIYTQKKARKKLEGLTTQGIQNRMQNCYKANTMGV